MKNKGHCPGCGVHVTYDDDPTCIECQHPCDVTFTEADKVELFFMLKGRGYSSTKRKLRRVLKALDPILAEQVGGD